MRHSAIMAAVGSAAWAEVFVTAGAAQVASVLLRVARSAPWRRLRVQSQVAQHPLEYRPLKDGRDDLHLPATAVRAVLHGDVQDPLEQSRPAAAPAR